MPKRHRLTRRWRAFALFGLAGAVALGLALLLFPRQARADPALARRQLAHALALFGRGEATAARSWALKATRADPSWGLAQAVLARAYVALGEGAAAEAALDRAKAAGFDPAKLHPLRAEALLLQGAPDRALKEAAKAPPAYGVYALRVAARALAAKGALPQAQALLAQALEATGGKDARGWVDLGRVRLQTGDVGGAIAAAARALALAPRDPDALALRADLVRGQYGLIAALPWYEAALKVDPWRHDILIAYAATLGDAGRYQAMLAASRRALEARPGSPQALYLQAVLAARAGNNELARALLQKTDGGLDGQPGPLLLAGILDFSEGATQQAIEKWRAVLAMAPMNLPARRLLGAALLDGGDTQAALATLRPLALRGDADSYSLTLVARAFEAQGERDWAATYLDRASLPLSAPALQFGTDDDLATLRAAAARAPENPVVQVEALRGELFKGDKAAALAKAQALAVRYPGVPQAHLLVGDVLMTLGRAPAAAAAYARAADLRFDEAVMLRSVEALVAMRANDKAAGVAALFLVQHPGNLAARRLIAHWQLAAEDWDAAIDSLEGLRDELGNRDAALLADLALAYAGDGQDDVAELYAAAAYRLQPMNPAVVDAYGWVLFQGEALPQATELLRKAAALAPGERAVAWHLAQAEAAGGERAAATRAITALLATPGFAEADAARALLATLRRG
ncbi:MAG: tetratricopeptide repeat protein [Sphingomonas sp.]|nr:tetratricopeptide repeat protein [Sphingomonas sp.]